MRIQIWVTMTNPFSQCTDSDSDPDSDPDSDSDLESRQYL